MKDLQGHGLALAFSPTATVHLLSADADEVDVDCVVCWGAKGDDVVSRSKQLATHRGLPFYFMEDGFVRSLGLGLKDERTYSFIKDDLGLHYLPQIPSRLEAMIQDSNWMTDSIRDRARALIQRITSERITKYNHAPILPYPFPTNTRRVLVCDQRYKDGSVTLAGYSTNVFERMVTAALRDNPGAEVWAKLHPDAITGGKGSYIAALPDSLKASLRIIYDDINPLSLLDGFDAVYVVSSQMGFEALMLGKRVHCFGLPFYAGWGLTHDDLALPRRGKASLECVFAAAYLRYTTYIQPRTGAKGELEDVIDYIVEQRPSRDRIAHSDVSAHTSGDDIADLSQQQHELCVIVPYREQHSKPDALDRIRWLLGSTKEPRVHFCVVDSGSSPAHAQRVRQLCREFGASYIFLDSAHEPFSVGRCRNAGAMYVNARYVMFQDIDLMPCGSFYESLFRVMEEDRLSRNERDFVMVPCVYLSPYGTQLFHETPVDERHQRFLSALYEKDEGVVENFAPGTSCIVVNRLYLLSLGGNYEQFQGHGFEDFDLNLRLMLLSMKFAPPDDLQHTTNGWKTFEYRGYRGWAKVYGDYSLRRGLFLVHLWHSPPTATATDVKYFDWRQHNKKLFIDRLRAFQNDPMLEHETLPNHWSGSTLCLGRQRAPFFRSLLEIYPLLGRMVFATESAFIDDQAFLDFVRKKRFNRVVFPNPYGNLKRLSLYRAAKTAGIQIVVSDRGALPDSVFFDSGFNADSDSYAPVRWDRELTSAERQRVEQYIADLRASEHALESQGARVGGASFRLRHSLGNSKVLFVAMQRPLDTVIRYFAGNSGGTTGLLRTIRYLSEHLPDDWRIVVKQHPLEDAPLEIDAWNVKIAPPEAHVHDLIEACNAVLVINSGVGVLSLAFNKPVIVLGDAFYNLPNSTYCCEGPNEVLSTLSREDLSVDRERVLRFIHYLRYELYSMGRFETRVEGGEQGSRQRVTTAIHFYSVNLLGKHLELPLRTNPAYPRESVLYDAFALYLKNKGAARPALAPNASSTASQRTRPTTVPVKPSIAESTYRKTRKLFRDPARFFADSKLVRRFNS
ncbi:MAG TPA: hypothetical protein VI197_01685 [Polyangiaceae bacterium]